jgi:RNA polymerase sigma-32 factor
MAKKPGNDPALSEGIVETDPVTVEVDEENFDPSHLSADGASPEVLLEEPEWEESSSGDHALATIDSLQRYMADIRRFERLSAEEERELAIRYQREGDIGAARRLVTGNLRLVVKVALEYRNSIMNTLDLIQEGNVGLLHALKKFDPERNVRFGTYATWWIKAYILRFILNNWSQVKFATSNDRRRVFFNLNKEKQRLEAQGITVGPKQLAETLNVSEEDIRDIEPMVSGGDLSLDQPISEDGQVTAMERLVSPDPLPDEIVGEDEFQRTLREKMMSFARTLKPREKILFERRLIAEEPARLQELGLEFGVTREAVRLMEKKIVGQLREYLERELQDVRGFAVARPSR